jgi:hypothetical protein
MFEEGRGVKRSLSQAYFWYSLAAAQGLEDTVSLRDAAAQKLKPAERATLDRKSAPGNPRRQIAEFAHSKQQPLIDRQSMKKQFSHLLCAAALLSGLLPSHNRPTCCKSPGGRCPGAVQARGRLSHGPRWTQE